jgi:hypothetical protein
MFENKMEYRLGHSNPGHLRLLESTTGSVVRLQSSDRVLTETFWNHLSSPGRGNSVTRIASTRSFAFGGRPRIKCARDACADAVALESFVLELLDWFIASDKAVT